MSVALSPVSSFLNCKAEVQTIIMETTIILLLCALFYVGYARANEINKDDPISINLKLVATADGKSFFADRTVGRNWTAAKQFCADYGMKLADVTTKAQEDALRAAYSPTDFYDGYWTSGRDIQQRQQFAWDTTGAAISNDNQLFGIRTDIEYQTCIYYWSTYATNEVHISFYYCNRELGTLCQT